jgi:hypothetical protein
MTRRYRLLLCAISLLVLPGLLMAQERVLVGQVLLVGQQEETTPAV